MKRKRDIKKKFEEKTTERKPKMESNEIDKEQEKAINQRPNYFAGQYLLEDDFQLEQKYHIDRQRRHNRLLHVSGIAEGLKVSLDKNKKVKVSAGTAIDSQGRQIILPDDQSVELEEVVNPKPLKDGEYTLSIRYKEELTEKQDREDKTHRRVQEKTAFELSKSTTPDVILLAKLTIKGGEVEKPDHSVRQYSGICLPTEDGNGVTLRSQDGENQNIAILDGSLTITGDLVVKSPTQNNQILSGAGNTENSETKEKNNTRQIKIGLDSNTTSYIQIEGGNNVYIEFNGIKISSQRNSRKLTIESTEPPETNNAGTLKHKPEEKESAEKHKLTIEIHADLNVLGTIKAEKIKEGKSN